MSQGEIVTFPANTQRSATLIATDSPSPRYEVSTRRCDTDTPYRDCRQIWFLRAGASPRHMGVHASHRHICWESPFWALESRRIRPSIPPKGPAEPSEPPHALCVSNMM